jgi:thioredoxin reductase (NADPH)
MSYYLIQQIAGIPEISVRTCTEVIAAHGDDHLEELTLRSTATGETETVSTQLLFVFIGAAPFTDWLDGVVVRDDRGFCPAGTSTGPPITWRRASRGCSWPATRAPSRPSGSPRPSVRAPWL